MNRSKGTVLVVDDDPKALALLVRLLGDEGYQVQPADSGKLALISVPAEPPDLILLDLRMPGIDGLEVCRQLKASPTSRHIPVMLISATADAQEWVQGLALGAVDFVSKPFRREELLARVRTHLELGQLQNQLELRVKQRTAELHNAIEQLQLEVAERRRAERALRESEERFRRIADTAPVIIWLSDANGMLTLCNKSGITFTGRTLEQLTGKSCLGAIHPDDVARFESTYSPAISSRQGFQVEYRLLRSDGEYRSVLNTGIPWFLDSMYQGHIGTITDITDLKRSQEEMFAAQNVENLRVLTAGVAHDFNTMLGAIISETDLAMADIPPDSPGCQGLERITSISFRAAEIIKLLMAYVGDRQSAIAREPLNLSALVQETATLFKFFNAKGVQVRTSLASGLPVVQGNPAQIRHMILNLIKNAFEALEGRGGSVTVTTAAVEIRGNSKKNLLHLSEGRYISLEVTDTGRGMTEEVQARIFDPYYTSKSLGHGLGLTAIQGIIREHGGGISVRSAPGEGSTFEVLLPIAETSNEALTS